MANIIDKPDEQNRIFKDALWLKDYLIDDFQTYFNLTDEETRIMSFHDFHRFGDTIKALIFEKYEKKTDWTEE